MCVSIAGARRAAQNRTEGMAAVLLLPFFLSVSSLFAPHFLSFFKPFVYRSRPGNWRTPRRRPDPVFPLLSFQCSVVARKDEDVRFLVVFLLLFFGH